MTNFKFACFPMETPDTVAEAVTVKLPSGMTETQDDTVFQFRN
jgi:hypothetical protein